MQMITNFSFNVLRNVERRNNFSIFKYIRK